VTVKRLIKEVEHPMLAYSCYKTESDRFVLVVVINQRNATLSPDARRVTLTSSNGNQYSWGQACIRAHMVASNERPPASLTLQSLEPSHDGATSQGRENFDVRGHAESSANRHPSEENAARSTLQGSVTGW
jgi:hypothetical protein